jgi:hypothetical protein
MRVVVGVVGVVVAGRVRRRAAAVSAAAAAAWPRTWRSASGGAGAFEGMERGEIKE